MLGSTVDRRDSSHQLVKQTPSHHSPPNHANVYTHIAGDLSLLLPDFQFGE